MRLVVSCRQQAKLLIQVGCQTIRRITPLNVLFARDALRLRTVAVSLVPRIYTCKQESNTASNVQLVPSIFVLAGTGERVLLDEIGKVSGCGGR